MKIIVVDDEVHALDSLMDSIKKVVPDAEVKGTRKPREAIDYLRDNPCDIAFLDIEMRGMNGIDLAKMLKQICPKINVIFVSGYSEYMQEAFAMYVSGYVLKPATPERVQKEIDNLRNPVEFISNKKVKANTFGNFEVFIGKKPVKFQYNRTKELFAYLIDRKGALCTNGEILGVLWGDEEGAEKKKSYVSNLRSDLVATFEKEGCGGVIVKQRGNIAIVPDEIECDYFDWLDGKVYAINAYQGEYMSQYSWAEFTLGEIESSF